jgi:iron complex outermembrane receptor protein
MCLALAIDAPIPARSSSTQDHDHNPPPTRPLRSAPSAIAAMSLPARAQGVATDQQLAPVLVTGSGVRSGLAADVPSNSASKTAEDLREQNLFNPEDALKYLPNTSIRKRYIGDRNSMIGGRSFGTLQPSRGLAYVDGYLISNFLGRFDGPRWNMINVEAIERVDALYGPFSAIYPGNSIGTTVVTGARAAARGVGAHHRLSAGFELTATRTTTTATSSRRSSAAG